MQNIDPVNLKSTQALAALLREHREMLLATWVDKIRQAFGESHDVSDKQLANHMLYVIDMVIEQLYRFGDCADGSATLLQQAPLHNDEQIDDKYGVGMSHGRQRAGINAYNADKVFWEYVILRRTLVEFIQQHQLLDLNHLEVITCTIENCSRQSQLIFSDTLQRVQRKLLGSVVHDIRRPLHVISMMIELANLAKTSEQRNQFTQKAITSTDRISEMLEDMLLTLTTEAGQGLELCFKTVQLHDFVQHLHAESATVYGNCLKLEADVGPVSVVLDQLMIERVIENLLSNAHKHGDKHQDITLKVSCDEQSIRISVHNFGPAIPAARLPTIFEYLKHFQGNSEQNQPGYGIGLAFVKAAVEGHNGSIMVSSEEAQGTYFNVELPRHGLESGQTITVPI